MTMLKTSMTQTQLTTTMKIQASQLDTLPRSTKLEIEFQRAGAGNWDMIELTIAELVKAANAKADAADHEIAEGALAAWEYYSADFSNADISTADEKEPSELRISKIFIYGAAMAEVSHSQGRDRIPLNAEDHFVNGEQGTDEKCLSSEGADYLEAELKRLNDCEEVNWA